MKKKIFYIITIFMIFMSINIKKVEAETHNLIYDIEELQVTKTKITFTGWAFIEHYHNVGGGKTKIKIAAKGGTEVIEKEVKYNSKKDKALYNANCNRNDNIGKCDVDRDSVSINEVAVCNGNCRYDNVGFTVTFSVDEIIEKLGKSKTIMFSIIVIDEKTGANETSEISVSSTAAKNIENGTEIKGTKATIKISGLSETAQITATDARVVGCEKGTLAYGFDFKWIHEMEYKIKKEGNDKSSNKEFGGLKMYQLEYGISGRSDCPIDRCIDYKKGAVINGTATQNGNCSGWAYASWVTLEGNLQIKLEDPKPEKGNCPNEYNNYPNNLNCSNGFYEQIEIEEIKLTDTFSADYSKYNLHSQECDDYAGSITRTITANACIKQTGTATFSMNPTSIYSGGGFNFSVNYYGTTIYEFCKNGSKYDVTMKIVDTYCDEYTSSCKVSNSGCGEDGQSACYESCRKTRQTTDDDSYEITKDSEEWELVTKYMKKLLEEPDDKAQTLSLNSNIVGSSYEQIGKWTSNYSDSNSTTWEPGETVTYELNFSLNQACINRKTAEIRYTTGICSADELDGGILYYTPLKYKSENFPIKVLANDVNVLKDYKWSINYECGVDCQQKLYKDKGFKFIYRPIDMSNPFPNRLPGNNWVNLIGNQEVKEETLSRDTLEYEIELTPKIINQIKEYNKGKNYADFSTIANSGASSYLNHSWRINTTYNKLGECSTDCW